MMIAMIYIILYNIETFTWYLWSKLIEFKKYINFYDMYKVIFWRYKVE